MPRLRFLTVALFTAVAVSTTSSERRSCVNEYSTPVSNALGSENSFATHLTLLFQGLNRRRGAEQRHLPELRLQRFMELSIRLLMVERRRQLGRIG